MDLATQVLVCLTVAALCVGATRLVPLPLPLVQTIAGGLLAWPLGMTLELDPHAFLLLLIPPLLFIDGLRMPKREFQQNRRTILLMAFGLVFITVLGVGLFIDWLVPAIPRPVAFAIAAALSPTDAVAVAGMTGGVTVPPRLMAILQGEALFNDASGLVSMRLAVAAMITGAFSWGSALGLFLLVALGGIVVGVVLAWLFVRVVRLVFGAEDETAAAPRILLLLIFPYAAYLAAEEFGLSGILAAVAAGMAANRFELVDPNHRATRIQGSAVLHMHELALNGLVFVLLGLQLPRIAAEGPAIAREAQITAAHFAIVIALVFAALLAIRIAWVWVSLRLTMMRVRLRGGVVFRPSWRLYLATGVAGVRGAVTLAAALTLPLTLADGSRFPARSAAILICAAVIVVWLVVASAGLPLLFRGVVMPSGDGDDTASIRARLATSAIEAIEKVRDDQDLPDATAEVVLDVYRARLLDDAVHDPNVRSKLLAVGIAAERATLLELKARNEISELQFRDQERQLDLVGETLAQR
ncbi:MAG: Na+/H+ antiporter [Deltaproteobacteria bacterium]